MQKSPEFSILRLISLVSVLLISSLMVLHLTNFDSQAESTKSETFYMGSHFELTGPGAVWGEPSLMALRMAVEEINAAGGFEAGGKHFKISFLEGDNEGKAEKAVVIVILVKDHKLRFCEASTNHQDTKTPIILGALVSWWYIP